MGFLDFFLWRNKDKETKIERVSIAELKPWLIVKKKQIEKQEESFLNLIQERIHQLIYELEEEESILKKINVEEKKAEEKIKLVVRENLNNYIDYLEKLISSLKNINKEKEIIAEINKIFSDFKKKSSTSFGKATFLIGKELASVNESIRNFFKDLENILKENKEAIDFSKIICSVEIKEESLIETEKIIDSIKKLIEDYESRISSLKETIKIKEEKIEDAKSSKIFIEERKKMEEIKKKKEELDNEIHKLKEIIDFKSLSHIFHSNEKKMNIIKDYKENFKEAFQKDYGKGIISLLNEANLKNTIFLEKIEEITKRKKEIGAIIINKTGIEDLENEKRKTKSEVEILNSKKFIEEKKYERLNRIWNGMINLIKEDLIKINVKVNPL